MQKHLMFWADIITKNTRKLNVVALNSTEEKEEKHSKTYKLFTNPRFGMYFKTFTVEPVYFLPYLYKRILKAGGKIHRKRIESFDELEAFDLIINSSGLGAQTIVKDDVHLKPIRGQVIRVKAPWLTHAIVDEAMGNYIIPKYEL